MVLPFVRALLADAEKTAAFARVASHLKSGAGRISVSGLTPPAKAFHYALLQRASFRPLIIVVSDNRAAEELLPVLQSFVELTATYAPEPVVYLPAFDALPFQNMSPHPEIQEARARALWRIASGNVAIAVVPLAASAIRLRDADYYAGLARTLRRGDIVDIEHVRLGLNVVGYTMNEVVELHGEYAIRGGILDVFPPETERPLRIELFGDEVESIRKFDPATQRSAGEVDEAVLLPLTETPVTADTLAAIHARLSGGRVEGSDDAIEEAIRSGGAAVFPGWEHFAPLAGAVGSIFDLMPTATVAVDEPERVQRDHDAWWARVEEVHERSLIGNLARPEDLYLTPEQWRATVASRAGIDVEQLAIAPNINENTGDTVEFASQTAERFHGSMPALMDEVRKLTADGQRVVLAAGNMGELERLADVFNEYSVPYRLGTRITRTGGPTYADEAGGFAEDFSAATLVRASVPEGVALPESKLVIFGSRDLFDESDVAATRTAPSKSRASAFLSDFRDLTIGDFVVHIEHGIGEYHGLREIEQPDGGTAEFMVLGYAEGARLYVPLTRLDLVQKFRAAEGGKPALSRLGTQQWAKTKAKVKKAMQDMADELLKLYAVRKSVPGYQFGPDGEFIREFEDAFEFSETDDQIAAIVDIKHDMESSQPMDRLLCGDVGYGKTEVSMRAAFKAVSDSKQVAVLAPTTVLAFQHYETFKHRFAAFPISIEMISRFRTARQQKDIVERVEAGKIDILIGTHRLLSKDIKFPDLGLVIIDEEQRFGVRHKERLKQLRKEVDVLAMSATPIPRTLHMSLVGLRDMSVIETPPKDRIAINTVVAAWDEKLIRSAIEQELERGGQAYFVHNRVDSIYEIAASIQELVPKARVLVGHGQMGEGQLEKIMLAFMRHEADVLVATTIIENGLDIPLCNTIIINRADRHGLSELYQLRGRVGRSNRRAYAYLLVPPDRDLTDLARRRLAALKEFSDLGAGFKIAALDLELRGAGNLLGGEQSGHIEAVGFELYTQMLERSVRELRGENVREEAETQLNLGLNIRIPSEYIPQENQRLRMYKRVAGVENDQQLADVSAELRDRYGDPPGAVLNLLHYAALKLVCQRVGLSQIERKRELVSLRFTEKADIDPAKLARFVAANKGSQFTPQGVLKFALKSAKADEVLIGLREMLEGLESVAVEPQ
jgi:transcription-repair coupling factor (superfamily II helicase)